MNKIEMYLEERELLLKGIGEEINKKIKEMPNGTLRVTTSKGKTQYFFCSRKNGRNGKYIRRTETELIKVLAQEDYYKKVLKSLYGEQRQIASMRKSCPDKTFEQIYEDLPKGRKQFVTPIILPDKEYIEQWLSLDFARKPFSDDAPEYYTDKGERVRSKSEIIIANLLGKMNIPYQYEMPLSLNNSIIIHPDFTILHVQKRKRMYLEHLGMMDDSAYNENAMDRILLYEENGIFPGDRLFLTHETRKRPLNIRILNSLFETWFK